MFPVDLKSRFSVIINILPSGDRYHSKILNCLSDNGTLGSTLRVLEFFLGQIKERGLKITTQAVKLRFVFSAKF